MSYTKIANLPWLYGFVAIILCGVLFQNFIMMKKAWAHAKELGFENSQIKKGLANGIIVSIIPTLPVLVVLLSLVPVLGAPLPWLRLSVIGSASFESFAASLGVEAVGEQLSVGGYTIIGWIAAVWCMTIGGSTSILWSALAIKPISKLYSMAEKINVELILVLGTGCLIGVMGYFTVNFGLGSIKDNGIVFMSSFITGAIMLFLGNKYPKKTWIRDFLMSASLIVGMVVACIVLG